MAYGLTQSPLLVAASSQEFTAADSASLSITSNITIEMWVKFTTTPSSGQQWGFAGIYPGASGTDHAYLTYIQNEGGTLKLVWNCTNGSTEREVKVNWTPSTGVWYHIAVTVSGGTVTWYVDGTSQGSGTIPDGITSWNNSTYPLEIGSYLTGATARCFNGRISLVRIWSVVRTQPQIAAALCSVLGSTANLAAEWTLNNTLNDNSGNGNTLTNVNSVTFGTDTPAVCAVPPAYDVMQHHMQIAGGLM